MSKFILSVSLMKPNLNLDFKFPFPVILLAEICTILGKLKFTDILSERRFVIQKLIPVRYICKVPIFASISIC